MEGTACEVSFPRHSTHLLMRTAFLWLCFAAGLFLPAATARASAPLRFSSSPPPLERGMFLIALADQTTPDVPPAADPTPEPTLSVLPGTASAGFHTAGGDWAGLVRDTGYLFGYQVFGYGILYVMPESFSNWSAEQKENFDLSRWVHNVTNPQIDSDQFYINYILHPYWGSAYYLEARGRGFGRWGSFAYACFASSLYEFVTEAFTEAASIQDIFVTPIAGALLGIALEGVWGELVAAGDSRSWGESALLFLVDPIGRTNRAADRLFGFQSGPAVVRLLPVIGPARGRGAFTGVELSMRW